MKPASEVCATALIYEAEAMPLVRERWPDAVIEDASSPLREGRFQVTVPGATCDDFYPWLLSVGFTCLEIELVVRIGERREDVYRWIEAAKALRAQNAHSQPEETS